LKGRKKETEVQTYVLVPASPWELLKFKKISMEIFYDFWFIIS